MKTCFRYFPRKPGSLVSINRIALLWKYTAIASFRKWKQYQRESGSYSY